jgi:cytochrome oxidase Cu insertion factor (SCO1/SenC/PrrC family)
MQAFGVVSVEGRDGYRDEHSTFVYVLDARSRLVKTMLASSGLSDDILDALHDRMVAQR